MSVRRVVVTGMGAVTSLGEGHENNWRRMLAGESGVRRITRFDASTFAVRIASEIEPLPRVAEDDQTDELGIHSRFVLVAGREAWADARLDTASVPPDRIGVFIGSGKGILLIDKLVPGVMAALEHGPFDYAAFLRRAHETMSGERRMQERYHQAGTLLARAVGASGPK